MAKRAWYTPETLPAALRCALLTVPDDFDFQVMIKGALVPLFDPDNFESHGALTPEQCAQWWTDWDASQDWIVPWNPYTIKLLRLFGSGLVGYWPLWDALNATQLRDYGQNAGHGLAVGAITLDSTGMGDGMTSVYLNAQGEYVDIYTAALAAALNPDVGTFSAWGAADNWGAFTSQYLISVGNATPYQIGIYATSGWAAFMRTFPGGSSSFIWQSTLAAGWHHIAATWDVASNAAILYIDGVARNNRQAGSSWAGASISTARIGARVTADSNRFAGKLAHAAIWDRVLTPEEIATLAVI